MNISFTGVTPIVGKPGTIKALKSEIVSQLGKDAQFLLEEATDLYRGQPARGLLTTAVNEGNEVGLLVTGENVNDVLFMRHGWGSKTAPSRHINHVIIDLADMPSAVKKVINLIISKF